MATNFKITPAQVNRKVEKVEKELKKHEKTDMAHAHPKGSSQKAAPLPAMRKY